MQDTNMTTPTSPFAPADIPDINSVPTSGAMPPMNVNMQSMPSAGTAPAPVPNPAIPAADSVQAMPTAPTQAPVAMDVSMADIPEPKLAVEEAPKDLTAKPPVIESQIPKAEGAKPPVASKPVVEAKKPEAKSVA